MLMGLRYSIYTEEEAAATTTEEVEGVILPRIGLVYKATPTISFFGTYNKGFDPFEKSFTVQIFKDPYKPLFSELLEAGVKAELFNKRFFGTLSAYQLGVNNIAVNANDISNPDLFIQRGKDKAVGVETELRGNLLSNLSASFTFAYNLAKIKESTIASEVNTIKENAPKFASSSWLKYTVAKGGLKGLQFSVGHSHQSLRNTLVKGLTMPGYTIFQTGLGYNYKKYKIAFNVDNLFNTMYWNSGYNYASKWPGLPRSMMIKIGYQIN
jgi:iron complex outermembrane receptor protein